MQALADSGCVARKDGDMSKWCLTFGGHRLVGTGVDGRSTPNGCWAVGGRSHAHRASHRRAGPGGRSARRHVDGTIMHSDRGTQYTARAMAQACTDAGLRRSMGATGICWDNRGAESRWSTFKHEYYYRHTFATKAEFVAAVDTWMHVYNTQRRHSVIGMLSPIAYEQSLDAANQAA